MITAVAMATTVKTIFTSYNNPEQYRTDRETETNNAIVLFSLTTNFVYSFTKALKINNCFGYDLSKTRYGEQSGFVNKVCH